MRYSLSQAWPRATATARVEVLGWDLRRTWSSSWHGPLQGHLHVGVVGVVGRCTVGIVGRCVQPRVKAMADSSGLPLATTRRQ